MLHLALHVVVPVLVALTFYRRRWRQAAAVLLATMIVDVDHLLASPVYDPGRCSIGFHPLHSGAALVLYCLLFGLPLVPGLRARVGARSAILRPPVLRATHLVGLGLLLHMALDWGDCLR